MRDPSHVLRHWASRPHFGDYVLEPFDSPPSTVWHTLSGWSGTNAVRISFGVVPDRPDVMRVRSTNWRCEHEPHGFMPIASARRLYRECLDAGMVVEGRLSLTKSN